MIYNKKMFYRNDAPVIADIIDQLCGKIKKINSVIKVLQKSIKIGVSNFVFEFNVRK